MAPKKDDSPKKNLPGTGQQSFPFKVTKIPKNNNQALASSWGPNLFQQLPSGQSSWNNNGRKANRGSNTSGFGTQATSGASGSISSNVLSALASFMSPWGKPWLAQAPKPPASGDQSSVVGVKPDDKAKSDAKTGDNKDAAAAVVSGKKKIPDFSGFVKPIPKYIIKSAGQSDVQTEPPKPNNTSALNKKLAIVKTPLVQPRAANEVLVGQITGLPARNAVVYKIPFEVSIDKKILEGRVQKVKVVYSVAYSK